MSAKRPRPAIPVLVHVDNPTEAGSVTVDTSSIEGKMDTVITNQNRIYDKIPTSSGGGGSSADLTTVNANTTALAETIGPANSTLHDSNLFGRVRNLVSGVGDFDIGVSGSGTTVRALLYNTRDAIGNSMNPPTTSGSSVRDLLFALKGLIGSTDSSHTDNNLMGKIKNLVLAAGEYSGVLSESASSLRSLLYNVRQSVGDSTKAPSATGTTVRDLLTAIKQNTASGGSGGSADLTTVNEKTTALVAAIGSASDSSSTVSVIGLLKSITDKY